jgi:hypothetical protein
LARTRIAKERQYYPQYPLVISCSLPFHVFWYHLVSLPSATPLLKLCCLHVLRLRFRYRSEFTGFSVLHDCSVDWETAPAWRNGRSTKQPQSPRPRLPPRKPDPPDPPKQKPPVKFHPNLQNRGIERERQVLKSNPSAHSLYRTRCLSFVILSARSGQSLSIFVSHCFFAGDLSFTRSTGSFSFSNRYKRM